MKTLSKNQQAKLQNAVTDLNWYAFRFLKMSGFRIEQPAQGLEMARRLIGQKRDIPPEIRQIVGWAGKIEAATPENANQLCVDCRNFVQTFDDKLAGYEI